MEINVLKQFQEKLIHYFSWLQTISGETENKDL